MTAARVLARLYPEAFREQWGPDLEAEIAAAGWRSWPDTLLGIADMWLHPGLWPADSRAERRLRTTTLAISLTALCWFVAHVGVETDDSLARGAGHSTALSAGIAVMLAGLVLIAPLPRPSVALVRALVRAAVLRFTLPVALAGAVVAVVRLGGAHHPPLLLRGVALAAWWTALAVGAARASLVAADLGARFVVPPRPGRLRLGVWVLVAGAATEAGALLGGALGSRADPAALGVSALSLALLPAFVPVVRACRPEG
ncbi:hypothetical protein [Actinomadura oligospora]|uniref:hypothetical protein n=1 Tax=Actinomadura oligospora TaxID=111804 RepID=UPI00047D3C7B|nr:hypothetical protein [Actinomadura oligospora]